VDKNDITQLNHLYRKQNKATNVLAFPANLPDEIALDYPLLGDVIICPEILLEESLSLQKPLIAHWALIVIHGVLHLLGYDHIEEEDARVMQALEITLLAQLGFDNPYHTEDNEIE
jgi:probable rRNA maturation factor